MATKRQLRIAFIHPNEGIVAIGDRGTTDIGELEYFAEGLQIALVLCDGDGKPIDLPFERKPGKAAGGKVLGNGRQPRRSRAL